MLKEFAKFLKEYKVVSLAVAASIGFITLVNAAVSFQRFFVLLWSALLSLFYPRVLQEAVNRKTVTLKLLAILCMFIGGMLVS